MFYQIELSPLECLALLWASGIESLLGVYDPLGNVPAASRRKACTEALERLKLRGYIETGEHNRVALDAAWLLTGCANAQSCLLLEKSGIDPERVVVFSAQMGTRLLRYAEGCYTVRAIDTPAELLPPLRAHLYGQTHKDYPVHGAFWIPTGVIRAWRTGVDVRKSMLSAHKLEAAGMPGPWAQHITRALLTPAYRGSVQRYWTSGGREESECYSLLLAGDGVAYELRNHGAQAEIRVESADDAFRRIEGRLQLPEAKKRAFRLRAEGG